jgi:hypothetical protein
VGFFYFNKFFSTKRRRIIMQLRCGGFFKKVGVGAAVGFTAGAGVVMALLPFFSLKCGEYLQEAMDSYNCTIVPRDGGCDRVENCIDDGSTNSTTNRFNQDLESADNTITMIICGIMVVGAVVGAVGGTLYAFKSRNLVEAEEGAPDLEVGAGLAEPLVVPEPAAGLVLRGPR